MYQSRRGGKAELVSYHACIWSLSALLDHVGRSDPHASLPCWALSPSQIQLRRLAWFGLPQASRFLSLSAYSRGLFCNARHGRKETGFVGCFIDLRSLFLLVCAVPASISEV